MTSDSAQQLQTETTRALQQAISLHQSGQLQPAEDLYRVILRLNPNHPDANHNLGVLAAQCNQPDSALPYLLTALKSDPTRDQFWASYIDTLLQSGRLAEAGQMIALARQHGLESDGINSLALRLQNTKPSNRQFNGQSSADAESHIKLGNTLLNSGHANEAIASYQSALRIKPDDAHVHCNLGVALRKMGRLGEAEACYRRALQINPSFAEALNNLGNTLKDMGQLNEAEASYRRALSLKPEYAEAFNNLGATLKELGKVDEAVACFRHALEIKPAYAEAHNNLGNALRDLGKVDAALESCRRALELKPDYADAHNNLGGLLKETGKIDESMASCIRALQLNPDSAVAHNNMGNALQTHGDVQAAMDSYRRALALQPDYTLARVNLGYAQLASGQLKEGWANHEFRTCINKMRFPHIRYWAGEDLTGRTILIWGEQGIGDEIMFASLFPEIIAKAKHCIIECAPKLAALFARSFPTAQVVPRTEPPHHATLSGIDYHCASGSLAQWLRPDIASFPQHNTFLVADPERVACWKSRLAGLGPGPKIGINWRSGMATGERTLHYTLLTQWGPILATPGAHFINLQYDECSAELEEARQRFGVPLHAFTEVDMYDDIDETAALIQALDLVICAPTAVSSISAALGVSTWIMCYGVVWATHGTDRDLWFPTLRYFNRRWDQTWDEIVGQVADQVEHLS